MKKIEVTMTAERLAAMNDNGNSLYFTPGAQAPYWNWQASFSNDVCLASPYDFIDTAGYDSFEDIDDGETFLMTFTVE